MAQNQQDKRIYKRAYIRTNVEYRGKSFWQMIEARDISAGGMFLATEKIEPPHTKISIMFELGKEKKPIYAEGVVRWIREAAGKDIHGQILPIGMGITFDRVIPALSKKLINDFVQSTGGA